MSNQSIIKLFDNTRVSAFEECQRKFLFRHIFDWAPQGTAAPLSFGSAWHAAMDVVWQEMCGKNIPRDQFSDVVNAGYTAFLADWRASGMPEEPHQLEDMVPRVPSTAHEMLWS